MPRPTHINLTLLKPTTVSAYVRIVGLPPTQHPRAKRILRMAEYKPKEQ